MIGGAFVDVVGLLFVARDGAKIASRGAARGLSALGDLFRNGFSGEPAYMSGRISSHGVEGTADESFLKLSLGEKVEVAFKDIEATFGKGYASATRELFESTRLKLDELTDKGVLGIFRASGKGPLISLNKNIGNSKLYALTILHETRHLRHFNKIEAPNYNQAKVIWNKFMTNNAKEIFATSTNVWQAKKLGLSAADMKDVRWYYNKYRGN